MTEPEHRPPLLLLCHRIPYPPNKGDKIRAFHLLHHLAQHFAIYLATFIDDPQDWPYREEVGKYCADALFLPLHPARSRLRSLPALLAGKPLSLPYYSSSGMQRWVDRVVAERGIERVLVYSSTMAQFVEPHLHRMPHSVIDFVDVDSDKWAQYATTRRWPMSQVYRREARCLLAYERHLAASFSVSLFVSVAEAEAFRRLAPESAVRVRHCNNGVNADYFCPAPDRDNPYQAGAPVIVFTGAMDYWPNVDAAEWFAQRVMPGLRREHPDATFYIVGSNPSRRVLKLADLPGVAVTGRVEDIRPYLQYADVAVAPMRVARGVQNKVLEAMAMARPVIASSRGLEGIAARVDEEVLLADEVEDYHRAIGGLLDGQAGSTLGQAARRHVVAHYDWANNLPEVSALLDGRSACSSAGATGETGG